jgi:hypothetical protein
MMRDLREELLELRGKDYPKWYNSLTKLEQVEVSAILADLDKN